MEIQTLLEIVIPKNQITVVEGCCFTFWATIDEPGFIHVIAPYSEDKSSKRLTYLEFFNLLLENTCWSDDSKTDSAGINFTDKTSGLTYYRKTREANFLKTSGPVVFYVRHVGFVEVK